MIEWLSNKKELLELFTQEEINQALIDVEYTLDDLTDKTGYRNIPKWVTPFEILKERHKFTIKEYLGEFSKDVEITGYLVRVPAQYQSLKYGALIHKLFENKYSWFNSFTKEVVDKQKPKICNWTKIKDIPEEYRKLTVEELIQLSEPLEVKVNKSLWKIYNADEMYLETEFDTLYVPCKAIINSDYSMIENRMYSYLKSYYNTPDRQEYYNKAIKALESKGAKQLKEYLWKQ